MNNQLPVVLTRGKVDAVLPIADENSELANNYNQALALKLVQNQTLDRVDHNVSKNVALRALPLAEADLRQRQPRTDFSGYSPTMDRNGDVGYTHIITPNFINDFRFGFNVLTSDVNNQFAQTAQTTQDPNLASGFPADVDNSNPGIPTSTIPGYSGLGSPIPTGSRMIVHCTGTIRSPGPRASTASWLVRTFAE